MTEELKVLVELLSKVSDGALTGVITYLVLNFFSNLVPWLFGCYLVKQVARCVPKIKIQAKE